MKVRDLVKQKLLEYPIFYEHKWDILSFLFFTVGNGYRWRNGELGGKIKKYDLTSIISELKIEEQKEIDKDIESHNQFKKALLTVENSKYSKCSEQMDAKDFRTDDEIFTDRLNRYESEKEGLLKDLLKDYVTEPVIRNEDGSVQTVLERSISDIKNKYSRVIDKVNNIDLFIDVEPLNIYIDSIYDGYSLITTIPDDVTDDWLDTCKEFCNYLLNTSNSCTVEVREVVKNIKFPR